MLNVVLLNAVMLSVVMLSVVMLNAVMLSVVILSVVVPHSGTLLANVILGWKMFQRQILLFAEVLDKQVNVFVFGKFFQSGLSFACKVGAYPSVAPFRCSL
jgi:hypothetical protein